MAEDQTEAPNEYAGPDEWPSIGVVYERALREMDIQIKEWEDADNRLKLLLGFIGVVLSLVLSATTNLAAAQWLVRGGAVLAVALLLVAASLALWAYRPQPFRRPPAILGLRTEFLTRTEAETKLAIVDELLHAYAPNREAINKKVRAGLMAQWILLGSFIALAVAVVARVFT